MSKALMARLDRLLANLGYGSRKEVQALVAAGKVVLDGKPLKDAGLRIAVDAALPERAIDASAPTGRHFGGALNERDARYFIDREWARDAEDILWRRTKEGLNMTAQERGEFAQWLQQEALEQHS